VYSGLKKYDVIVKEGKVYVKTPKKIENPFEDIKMPKIIFTTN
jgi:hypothetical protein